MYSLAEARYHLQNVRRRADIGVEIADVNETPVQKARKIIALRNAAKAKDQAKVSSKAEFEAMPWKGRAVPELGRPRAEVGCWAKKRSLVSEGNEVTQEGVSASSSRVQKTTGKKTDKPTTDEKLFEHPWRKGAAIRLPYRTGSKQGLDDVSKDKEAIRKLVNAKFAKS